jgi:hypothetical protein
MGAVVELTVLKKAFGELAPLNEVRDAISLVSDPKQITDLHKRIEAARKYDNKTAERRNYFGELAIWSERHIGTLIKEAQESGIVNQAGSGRGNTNKSPATLAALLGVNSNSEAQHISSRSKKLLEVTPKQIEAAIGSLKLDGEEVSKAAVNRKIKGAHVGHNSGENEWYTPAELIAQYRAIVVTIDVDPASSKEANVVVQAKKFYDAKADGLTKKWVGSVWMNPPYSSGLIEKFASKLLDEIECGNTTSAAVLVNNGTETKWAQSLFGKCNAVCFLSTRVKFWEPGGKVSIPLQGQMLLYFGADAGLFAARYRSMGVVMGNY